MSTGILWFRRDLRLTDNPALHTAISRCDRLIPVYIHAPAEEAPWSPGAASRWWLHNALLALDSELRRRGSRLLVAKGPSLATLQRIARDTGADRVFWNRLYDPATLNRDKDVKAHLSREGLVCDDQNAGLLCEPWDVLSGKGAPYRVFSAFWKACHKALEPPSPPRPAPGRMPPAPEHLNSDDIGQLELLPRTAWYEGLKSRWRPGEAGAQSLLDEFLDGASGQYAERRDQPFTEGTSRLSPHLHFGEIGPRQIIWAMLHQTEAPGTETSVGAAEAFLRQLGWREFAHHLLYHFPETPERPLAKRFEEFPWRAAEADSLEAWQKGGTGIPIVDAGMRQLWSSGWMHNRVRMLVASLFTKNLRFHWQQGARWFWDTLVDADLANNTLGWQWVAGCGADAAPYFRVFNPVRQGERFDPDGEYVRRWVPELERVPAPWIHCPWEAPAPVLRGAGVQLGATYPRPIVDLGESRKMALEAWDTVRNAR